MTMITESEKYKKVLKILRKSKPDVTRPENLEENIMNRIIEIDKKNIASFDLVDYLFGWIYIGWVRRSLVAASLIMVFIFVWQQAGILKQVKKLSKQVIVIENGTFPGSGSEIGQRLMVYKISDQWSRGRAINISQQQVEQLLESYNDLQKKYKDLVKIIEENPVLKEYIEKKLNENENEKSNL